jgi:GNAT superfamily N-acetyltransferase
MGGERASPERRSFVEGLLGSSGLGNTGMSLADLTPAGVLFAGEDYQRAKAAGNAPGAVGAAVGLIPAARGLLGSGAVASAKSGASAISERLSAKYPEVDFWISGRDGGPLTLSKVVVPESSRNKGLGTSFMRDLMDEADAIGAKIALSPSSDFGGNKARLTEWYSSLGFAPNKGRSRDLSISETMVREPNLPLVGGD